MIVMTTFPLTEQKMRTALEALVKQRASLDAIRLDRDDAGRLPFLTSVLNQTKPWSAAQMIHIIPILLKYHDKLIVAGVAVPDRIAMEALKTERENVPTQSVTPLQLKRPFVDIREETICVSFPTDRRFNEYRKWIEDIKIAIQRLRDKLVVIKGFVTYDAERREWRIPFCRETWDVVTGNSFFSPSFCGLSPSATAYNQKIAQEKLSGTYEQETRNIKHEQEYATLLATVNNLQGEIAPGISLYAHQKVGAKFGLWRKRIVIGDETGCGKTPLAAICAKALHEAAGLRVYIVTTVSSMTDWVRWAETLHLPVEVYSTDRIPIVTEHFPSHNFVLIADEAHKFQNMSSARTKKFVSLALHDRCQAIYCLTGTVMPNGRPINMYPLLLACKHPLVYAPSAERVKYLRNKYEQQFCGKKRVHVGAGKYVWDISGATDKGILNKLVMHVPGLPDNHKDACIIAREKSDCLDLPPKQRIMRPADINKEDELAFKRSVVELWDRFERRVVEKMTAFPVEFKETNNRLPTALEIAEKEKNIRKSVAIVEYNIFRHSGAIAKIADTVEQASLIVDRGHKVVIFTSFIDVAKEIGRRMAEETGCDVGYIMGEVKRDERDRVKDAFQDKTSTMKVVISTAAGGEAITLTAASYMFIVDRPWTPGCVQQWEDRIHRISQTESTTIYWEQLPKALCAVDLQVDEIIREKKINIDAVIFNRQSDGLQFVPMDDLESMAEGFMRETATRFRKSLSVA